MNEKKYLSYLEQYHQWLTDRQGKGSKAVQVIVDVSDAEQIEKIRKEVESLDDIKKDIKYWDYTEVLEVHEALQKANESINKAEHIGTSKTRS